MISPFVGCALYEEARYKEISSYRADHYAQDADEAVKNACISLSGRDKAVCLQEKGAEARLQKHDNERNEADLVAQRKSALWTSIMGFAALIGMGLSAIGVYLVWTTFRATRQANEIAREAMTADNRAWVEIVPNYTFGDLRYEGEEFRLNTKFSVKNIGKSVALHVGYSIDLIPDPLVFPQSKAVAEFKERLISQSKTIDTWPLFPARELAKEWDIGRRADELALDEEGPAADAFLPAICIGVRYNTIFDREGDPPHITVEVAAIRRVENGQPAYSINGRANVPRQKLALVRSMINLTDVT
jgi:hypothetical protein